MTSLKPNAFVISSLVIVLFCSQLLNHSPFVRADHDNDDDDNPEGLTFDLIHRECNPSSPFFNPSHSPSDQLQTAVSRSESRPSHFNAASQAQEDEIESNFIIPSNTTSYLIKLSIGTPPVEFLALADTGSDLIWTQCEPCVKCYEQDTPLFDSRKSSTYHTLPCDHKKCNAMPKHTHHCDNTTNVCRYGYFYGDGSYTKGILSSETLTFGTKKGKSKQINNIVFGCSNENAGLMDSHGSGLVGIGNGRLSLVSQLNFKIGKRFSYCQVPYFQNNFEPVTNAHISTKLNFGKNAIVDGDDKITTPIVSRKHEVMYQVTLGAISVGDKMFVNERILYVKNSTNLMIDSGTTLTYLKPSLYNNVVGALKEAIGLTPIKDDSDTLDLCYSLKDDLKVPDLTYHLAGGDLILKQSNTFIQLDENLICFNTKSTTDSPILGNLAQTNFLIGFDLNDKTVSFAPKDCTNL